MMSTRTPNATKTSVYPIQFEKRWNSGNFKYSNPFSIHDNYNLIQDFGEYIDSGYGKRYIEDRIHKSNRIFMSDKPFTRREARSGASRDSTATPFSNYHHRFPKKHSIKINSAQEGGRRNIDAYLEQKEKTLPKNSLNFESEMFTEPKPSNLIATEPFRQAFIHPWKYSYKTIDYQTCTEQFKRVKSSCIDLSKY